MSKNGKNNCEHGSRRSYSNVKLIDAAMGDLTIISGQKPLVRKS